MMLKFIIDTLLTIGEKVLSAERMQQAFEDDGLLALLQEV